MTDDDRLAAADAYNAGEGGEARRGFLAGAEWAQERAVDWRCNEPTNNGQRDYECNLPRGHEGPHDACSFDTIINRIMDRAAAPMTTSAPVGSTPEGHAIGLVVVVQMGDARLQELRAWCTCGDPVFIRLYHDDPVEETALQWDRAHLGTSIAWVAHRAKVGAP